jgi:hypothetical protein
MKYSLLIPVLNPRHSRGFSTNFTGNHFTFEKMKDDMDIDAGKILTGEGSPFLSLSVI